jgi:hypothetical protein
VVGHPLKCVLVSVAEQPNTSLGHVHLIFRLTRKEMISRHAHYVVRRMIPRYLQIFAASFVIPGVFLAISRRGVLYPQVLHMAEFYLGLAVILCAIVLVSHEIRCFRAKDQPFDTTVSMKPDDVAFMFGRANLITLPISRVKFTKVRDGLIVEFGRRLFALIPFRVISSDDRARIAKLYGFRL